MRYYHWIVCPAHKHNNLVKNEEEKLLAFFYRHKKIEDSSEFANYKMIFAPGSSITTSSPPRKFEFNQESTCYFDPSGKFIIQDTINIDPEIIGDI